VKNYTGLAIILLALVVLILGIPFSLNQYAQYSDRQAVTVVTTTISPPVLLPNPNLFGKFWCRTYGLNYECIRFFPDHSYEYGIRSVSGGPAPVLMPGQWKQISENQYIVPDPQQTFEYSYERLFTNINSPSGPLEPSDPGSIRTR
jgi:hypothetical protein